MIPTYDGLPIFGSAATVLPKAGGAARQINAYPGVGGTENLIQGDRGLKTHVGFELTGATLADLRVARNTLYNLVASGKTAILVDSLGQAWPSVYVESCEPTNPVANLAGGGYAQSYVAVLTHEYTPIFT